MVYDFKTHKWHYRGTMYDTLLEGLRVNDPRRDNET